jgi:endo-beta-N-acetylglucosaminidase D
LKSLKMAVDLSCKPICCFDELLDWDRSKRKPYKTEKLDRKALRAHDGRQHDGLAKVMLCHDMKNNYLEDKYFQGCDKANGYRFYDWDLIDSFIYFSHHSVTIPTESFINACHLNDVRIYGERIDTARTRKSGFSR